MKDKIDEIKLDEIALGYAADAYSDGIGDTFYEQAKRVVEIYLYNASPCAKCEKQQQMLETMAATLRNAERAIDADMGYGNAHTLIRNTLTTYKQFMEGK